MPRKRHHRGHIIVDSVSGWRYADTRELVRDNPDRECGHCNRPNRADGHDACLGELPGVMNACCGHGADRDELAKSCDALNLEISQLRREHAAEVERLNAHWTESAELTDALESKVSRLLFEQSQLRAKLVALAERWKANSGELHDSRMAILECARELRALLEEADD